MWPDSLRRDLVEKVVKDGYSIANAARELNVPYGTAQQWVTQMGDLMRREMEERHIVEYTLSDGVSALHDIAKELKTLNRFLENLDLSVFN